MARLYIPFSDAIVRIDLLFANRKLDSNKLAINKTTSVCKTLKFNKELGTINMANLSKFGFVGEINGAIRCE
jgi:hypothetical protein